MRIGMGYDVHKLVDNRPLIIGGVEIPYHLGLLGHSDADVLLHAVMDALLGAAALGDIGKHFPDTDEAYKGISSMVLLEKVGELLEEKKFLIDNIDATIIAQAPKMRPYIDTMRENIAKEYCRYPADFHRSGQCKGNDRGRLGLYRRRTWYFFTGNLYVDNSKGSIFCRCNQFPTLWRMQRMWKPVKWNRSYVQKLQIIESAAELNINMMY